MSHMGQDNTSPISYQDKNVAEYDYETSAATACLQLATRHKNSLDTLSLKSLPAAWVVIPLPVQSGTARDFVDR